MKWNFKWTFNGYTPMASTPWQSTVNPEPPNPRIYPLPEATHRK